MADPQSSRSGAARPLTLSLIGMPGGGKSTVGRQLSRALGLPFIDSDEQIEQALGLTIRAFFEAHGEQRFREIEEATIDHLTQQGSCVLATGGGAVLRESNRNFLHDRTIAIYLRATPEELFRRLRHDTQRPLLQVDDPQKKLRDLFHQRDPLYRSCAHFTIETARPSSVPALVNMILMQLELAGVVDPSRVPPSAPPTGGKR